MEEYAVQTMSTPLVIASPDKQRWLMNKDSYRRPRKTTFAFVIDSLSLDAILKKDEIVSFRPLDACVEVKCCAKSVKWNVDEFLRDDRRKMCRWKYPGGNNWRSVNVNDLKRGFMATFNRKLKHVFCSDSVKMIFDDGKETLLISPLVSPAEHRVEYCAASLKRASNREMPINERKRPKKQENI